MGGLSVSNLVNVTVTLTQAGALGRSFSSLLIAGDSNVINGVQRIESFSNITGVGALFGTTTPEYQAAELFFSQNPAPSQVMIGRWLSAATAALNDGGILSPSQEAIGKWTSISNGGFDITVDGAALTVTGLDFTAQTNLNGVATVITAGIATAGGSAVCTWNGSNFIITSSTTGIGLPATGTITFTGAGSNNDTITVNGLAITLVTGTPSTNQVKIGGSAAATAANLLTFLQNSSSADITPATYTADLGVITVTYKTVGTGGNAFTLAKSSTAITLSASALAGGTVPSAVGYATAPTSSYTDISSQLMLTAATSQALVPGYAAEAPVDCVNALANLSPNWYGIGFASTASITDDESLAVSAYIEATPSNLARIYGVTTQESGALSSLSTTDLGYKMNAAGYNQSFIQYSSTSQYAVFSLFGRMFTVNYDGSNTVLDLMYKQEPGVTYEVLNQQEAQTLQTKQINCFVQYDNSTQMIQFGNMSSGNPIYLVMGSDWVQNALQTAGYNALYTIPTKLAQTDAGVEIIVNALAAVCQQAVNNGFAAPGVWNSAGFGSLVQGQYLKLGYYIFNESVDLQSEADRAAGKCPPIQIALKGAGSIRFIDIGVTVNQ